MTGNRKPAGNSAAVRQRSPSAHNPINYNVLFSLIFSGASNSGVYLVIANTRWAVETPSPFMEEETKILREGR